MPLNKKFILFNKRDKIDKNAQDKWRGGKCYNLLSFKKLIGVVILIALLIPLNIFKAIKNLFKSPKSLEGKLCLVTGAGRGLGRELCLQLGKEGAEVICVDIREDANDETVRMLKEIGGKAHGYKCNVAKYEEVTKLAETVRKEVGRVYLLINNAGLIMTHKAGEWPSDDVVSMFNVNVFSHYWMIQSFLPEMRDNNEGHIVGIVSAITWIALAGASIYGSTKAATNYILENVRLELESLQNNKIKVTGVYPSFMDTSIDMQCFIPADSMNIFDASYSASQVIDGIKHDENLIVIPRMAYLELLLMKMLPNNIIVEIFKSIRLAAGLPSNSIKENLIFSKIKKECL